MRHIWNVWFWIKALNKVAEKFGDINYGEGFNGREDNGYFY